jgi:hypothetical protein
MKQFTIGILVILFFSAWKIVFASPCDDSLYQVLKKRDLNSLTQNEVSYMLSKDQLCEQEKKEAALKKEERNKVIQDSISKESKHPKVHSKVVGMIVFVIVLVAAISIGGLFGSGVIKP